MDKVIRSLAVLALGIGIFGACTSTSDPLPPAAAEFPAEAPAAGLNSPVAGSPAPAVAPAPAAAKPAPAVAPATAVAKPAPTPAKPAASSCEVVREALLTGTQTQINSAMTQLQGDRTADAKAREEASDYLRYTDKDLKALSVSLIRMYCS